MEQIWCRCSKLSGCGCEETPREGPRSAELFAQLICSDEIYNEMPHRISGLEACSNMLQRQLVVFKHFGDNLDGKPDFNELSPSQFMDMAGFSKRTGTTVDKNVEEEVAAMMVLVDFMGNERALVQCKHYSSRFPHVMRRHRRRSSDAFGLKLMTETLSPFPWRHLVPHKWRRSLKMPVVKPLPGEVPGHTAVRAATQAFFGSKSSLHCHLDCSISSKIVSYLAVNFFDGLGLNPACCLPSYRSRLLATGCLSKCFTLHFGRFSLRFFLVLGCRPRYYKR